MRSINNKNILVTGGAGFIGSHLVDALYQNGANQVVVIDNMFLGDEKNLSESKKKGVILYKDDAEFIETLKFIIKEHKIEIIFNCATKALNYSFINPRQSYETNTKIILNLLELLREKDYSTLCHFSTSEVYGTAVYEPMDEQHPKNPTTLYAAGKAAADLALETYVRMFDLDAFIVRPFNNYGPRQNFRGPLAGVIPLTVKRILNGISPEVHGSGKQSRDFIFVKDTVVAILKLFEVQKRGESINISTNGQITIKELIEKICLEMDYKGEIVYKQSRNSDVFCHNASNKKINDLIEYNLTSFKIGLSQTIDWYKTEVGKDYND